MTPEEIYREKSWGGFRPVEEPSSGIVTLMSSADDIFEYDDVLTKDSNISQKIRKSGNDLFNQRNHNETVHRDTLSCYTKCIALAPKGSEELALGYSNRSVLLKHLQRYEECLIDIDIADAITKSDQLKKKLQTRKEECLALLINSGVTKAKLEESIKNLSLHGNRDQNNAYSEFLKPAVPSDMIPDASDSVALNYNKTLGRHLIATRDIKPGEIIMNEKGYICLPYYNQMYLICSHCLHFCWNAIPCDDCVYAVYCSKTCKEDAWKEYHDEECSVLPYLFGQLSKQAYIIDVMGTTRLLIKAIKKEGLHNIINESRISKKKNNINQLLSDGILHNEKFRSYYNLMFNEKITREHAKLGTNAFELAAINLLFRRTNLIRPKGSKLKITPQEEIIILQLKKLFLKLENIFNGNAGVFSGNLCNCDNMDDCNLNCPTKRGLTITPCSSLVNHSCSPNAERMCVPHGRVVVYTSAPVKKGEQICFSYGPLVLTNRSKRQKILKELAYFDCKCIACTEDWSDCAGMNLCRDPATDHITMLHYISQLDKERNNDQTSSSYNTIIQMMEFDEKTLKHAIKFSEWVYKHYEKGMAFVMSETYRMYISAAFYKLFGEKCVVPASCR